ncbi:SA1362 family protein [Aquibacillus kalidii]|uniref:SA1362 family protein n=1 Tax=Aquibacillus kalidii TaxID=2762597 RepID=UPI001646380D|nr:SA1362 family protein [Aquibacillus kalidii]
MFRHKLSLFIYLLIGLAIFGFATQLITNTASLIINLLVMVAIGAVIYGALYYFVLRKRNTNELKKYRKAVKQSKMKYKKDSVGQKSFSKMTKQPSPLKNNRKPTRERATHLRVIEGNKHKRKNRASF